MFRGENDVDKIGYMHRYQHIRIDTHTRAYTCKQCTHPQQLTDQMS